MKECPKTSELIKKNKSIDYNAILSAKTSWTDPDFGKDGSVIAWVDQEEWGTVAQYIDYVKWRKLSTYENGMYKNEWRLWGDNGAQPDDVKQGFLNNCWFFGAIQSMAENKGTIEALFNTNDTKLNDAGIYAVNFRLLGNPVTVYVDDWMPFITMSKGKTTTLFGDVTDTNKAIWPLIMEKAYAKLHGNYEHMDRGSPTSALFNLTGVPAVYYDHDKEDQAHVWAMLKEHTANKDHVQCQTRPSSMVDNKHGLVSSHIYSI